MNVITLPIADKAGSFRLLRLYKTSSTSVLSQGLTWKVMMHFNSSVLSLLIRKHLLYKEFEIPKSNTAKYIALYSNVSLLYYKGSTGLQH